MSKSRKYNQETKKISTWEELAECKSDTHKIDINIEGGFGRIFPKIKGYDFENSHYLSTHTFYGSNYKESTRLLQSCGFNVEIANWDKEEVEK